jgi:hypothetical protein
MYLTTWLRPIRRIFRSSAPGPRKGSRPRSCRLQCEPLEARWLPSTWDTVYNILLNAAPEANRGFYVKPVGSPAVLSYHETESFEPASLIKVLIHLHAMRQVQLGAAHLTDPISYYFDPGNPGSGGVCPDSYPHLPVNKLTTTLGNALQLMMQNSDNRLTQAVEQYFGGGGVITLATANLVGMPNSNLSQFVTIGCGTPGNYLSLADTGRLYEKVENGTLLQGIYQSQFYQEMLGGGMWAALQPVVTQEAAAQLNKPANDPAVTALVTAFGAGVNWNGKGGSYTLTAGAPSGFYREIRTEGDIVRLPYHDANQQPAPRSFAAGVFIENAWSLIADPTPKRTQINTAMSTGEAEALRDEVHDALATWRPAAVAGLSATAVSSSQINLSWSAVPGATGYKVERYQGGWQQIGTTAAGVTTLFDTNLAAGTTYSYRVRATGLGGDGNYSPVAQATTYFVLDLQLLVQPPSVQAGLPFSLTLTARDRFGHTAAGYRGTVSFSSNDSRATVPGNYTFTASDNGVHTFTDVILRTAGSLTLTVRDTASSVTGNGSITVNPAAANHFDISAPSSSTAGAAFDGTVTARDPYGNVATGYRGTVNWSSGDTQATLPPNYTFTAGDGGVHPFRGLVLRMAGNQIVTVRDAGAGFSASAGMMVSPAAASQVVISAPGGSTAGTALPITLTVRDPYHNLATGYRGTMNVSTDDAQATLPASYTFTAADAGVHTFANGVILRTAGNRTVTAKDVGSGFFGNAAILVNPGPVGTLTVMGFPSPTTAGIAGSFTVAAKDPYGNLATGYRGAIHVTSSDGQALLPADYTFMPTDNGVHTFGATLKTAGTQALTATDMATGSITGTQGGIVVNPAATSVLVVAGFPSPIIAGTAGNITVTAKDTYGNISPSFTGTVHFTSTDSQALLPADYAFLTVDHGVHTFPVTLKTAGMQTITATDTHSATISGTQTGVLVTPAAPDHFQVTTLVATTVAGAAFDVTVMVQDAFRNTVTGYTGTITCSSADPYGATLPADYPFTAADHGVHTFRSGAALYTAGSWDVTATDTVSGIAGSATVAVTPAAADHFRVDAPDTTVAGQAVDVAVTALDPYGNTDVHYTGTITFSSSDPNAGLPPNYTFTAADQGMVVLVGGATLFLAGSQSITVTDVAIGLLPGSALVSVTPAAADHFQVDAPATVAPNMPFDVTVTALDPYGNADVNYRGTVAFAATDPDPGVVLPMPYTFNDADSGMHLFAGAFALVTPGEQTLTVTDTLSGISGSSDILVDPSGSPGSGGGGVHRPGFVQAGAGSEALAERAVISARCLGTVRLSRSLGWVGQGPGEDAVDALLAALVRAERKGVLFPSGRSVPGFGEVLPAGAVDGLFASQQFENEWNVAIASR